MRACVGRCNACACVRIGHRGWDERGADSPHCLVTESEEVGEGEWEVRWVGGRRSGRLTVRFQSIMRRNSRSRTLSSVTGIPPTLA